MISHTRGTLVVRVLFPRPLFSLRNFKGVSQHDQGVQASGRNLGDDERVIRTYDAQPRFGYDFSPFKRSNLGWRQAGGIPKTASHSHLYPGGALHFAIRVGDRHRSAESRPCTATTMYSLTNRRAKTCFSTTLFSSAPSASVLFLCTILDFCPVIHTDPLGNSIPERMIWHSPTSRGLHEVQLLPNHLKGTVVFR